MWFPSLILFLAFASAFADIEEDLKRCENLIEQQEMTVVLLEMKETSEFDNVCSTIIEFFTCVDEALQSNVGVTLEQMRNMLAGTDIGKVMDIMVNVRNLAVDVCTEGSQLHEDIMADMQCFDDLEDPTELCTEKAREAYEVFKSISDNIQDEDDDFYADRSCMETAYLTACVASVLHDKCGERAFKTFNSMVKRSSVFRNALCSKENLEDLKTNFLHTLDMTNTEKDLFRLAFDLRKRRK